MSVTVSMLNHGEDIFSSRLISLPDQAFSNRTMEILSGVTGWRLAVTLMAILVAYDQCTGNTFTSMAKSLLTSLVVMYVWRKGSIAGPRFKLPFMGPFVQALNPKFDAYLAQWASGPLSCVSVFHKYVSSTHHHSIQLTRELPDLSFSSPTEIWHAKSSPLVPTSSRASCLLPTTYSAEIHGFCWMGKLTSITGRV